MNQKSELTDLRKYLKWMKVACIDVTDLYNNVVYKIKNLAMCLLCVE